jgi:hypothetical protein
LFALEQLDANDIFFVEENTLTSVGLIQSNDSQTRSRCKQWIALPFDFKMMVSLEVP